MEENTNRTTYFFTPRVSPERYADGWEGYRTLVLGVFHVCTQGDCPFRSGCLDDSSAYDGSCPSYAGMSDYYRLSNSNEIEIESYLEGEVKYPTYSSITKYLCQVNRHLNETEKRELWDSIAYTNFLQDYREDYDAVPYEDNMELFDRQLPALKSVLDDLHPEVIYVIDTAVTDCIRSHIGEFPGLDFIDENQDWTLPIYRFTFNVKPKDDPEEILGRLGSFSGIRDEQTHIRRILKCLEKGRARTRPRDAQIEEILPHIWDRAFEDHLYRRLLAASLSEKQSARLSRILRNLHYGGYTEFPDNLIFLKETPRFGLQYQRDGIVIEIADMLKDSTGGEVKPYLLARAMGYDCGSSIQWRTERKNEYSRHKDACRSAIRFFLSEIDKCRLPVFPAG